MHINIREFQPGDYDSVVEIWANTQMHVGQLETREMINRIIQRNPTTVLVALDAYKLVGIIIGTFDGRRAYVYKFAVDPAYQHQKIGTQLVNALLDAYKTLGVKHIMGFVSASNPGVLQFYEKFGAKPRPDMISVAYDLDKS
jgi:ribosomal protein S18 acetylase RimI-like enzyme